MKYVISCPPKGKYNYVKAGLKMVIVGMVMHVSSHMVSSNSFVINQHWEKKFVGIFINTSTVSLVQDVTLFMKSNNLIKSLSINAMKKWLSSFQNLSLRWGLGKIYSNFFEKWSKILLKTLIIDFDHWNI